MAEETYEEVEVIRVDGDVVYVAPRGEKTLPLFRSEKEKEAA